MAVTASGILGYDIRTALKVVAGEGIGLGESCYIGNDGLAYVVDNAKSTVCHGWALETVSTGDSFTLVTTTRMKVATAQIPGNRVYTGNVAGGSAPSTTLAAVGVVVGYAISTSVVFVSVPTPAADAGAP